MNFHLEDEILPFLNVSQQEFQIENRLKLELQISALISRPMKSGQFQQSSYKFS